MLDKMLKKSQFVEMSKELLEKLKLVDLDDEMDELGFECEGRLQEFEGFEDSYERLWVWISKTENGEYIAVTSDNGNGHCTVEQVNFPFENANN